ncbi:MAG TPA: copper resistance protein CopC [Ktedonobacteraceae bacterium]|nr:copper resistance protein CopC [Ktedonobacteraceae bacterium]
MFHFDVKKKLPWLSAAFACACLLLLFFPATSEAHAILLRSEPSQDAILNTPPQQVKMWFSEDLNPSLSTAVVVNTNNQRVDNKDAHIASSDTREMDLTLPTNLTPDVYVVVWRSSSSDDGHVLRGSFIFTIARPDGSVPSLNGGARPGANVLGGSSSLTGLYTGQFDGPTLLNFVMISLVELGVVFWVGAQLWLMFVLQPASDKHPDQRPHYENIQRIFEKRWSVPILLILLLANIGVLVGQALVITGGDWSGVSLTLLDSMLNNGRFGTFWLMREIVIFLALLIGLIVWCIKQPSAWIKAVSPWLNMILGLALLIAITLSGHASAVPGQTFIFAVLIDWLHLLGAALWVGGMLYIVSSYLPVLKKLNLGERTNSLITLLPYYSPWAVAGIVILAITGPFSASFHMTSWMQFLTTAYGRALLVKIVLVGLLMLTSAIHVFWLRPRLKKEYKKYAYLNERAALANQATMDLDGAEVPATRKLIQPQLKLREQRLSKGTERLTTILRWEPLLGVAVLLCVGLMNVFAGTLTPTAIPQQASSQPGQVAASGPFKQTLTTTDSKFKVTLTVDPNRFGTNTFTVRVVDTKTNNVTTNAGVSLYTTMLDMDMGTDSVNLLPDGKGAFSGPGDLAMSGNWRIRIQVRTPDNTLHEASVKLNTPF